MTKILVAQSETYDDLQDELTTTAFQWAKADREHRMADAARLQDRINDIEKRIEALKII